MKKYFILKDFLGMPLQIVSGHYRNDRKVSGDFKAPFRLSKGVRAFDSVEQMLGYRFCKCGKTACNYNNEYRDLIYHYLWKNTN